MNWRSRIPALGDQLRIVISEMRAGKGRLEAFQRAGGDRTKGR